MKNAALSLLVFLFSLPVTAGEDGYRLWYAPYAVLKVERASQLGELAKLPLATAVAPLALPEFSKLPVIGTTTVERFVEALLHYHATGITYAVLPPPVPLKAVFSARISGASDPAVRNAFVARAGLAATIEHAGAGGRVYLASDSRILKDYVSGSPEFHPWLESLNRFLQEKHDGASLWVNEAWILGILSYKMGAPLTERLVQSGFAPPSGLVMSVTTDNSWSLQVPMPVKSAGPAGVAARPLSLKAIGSDFSLQIDLDQGARAPGLSPAELALQTYEVIFPESSDGLKGTMSALQLLIGAHIREDILSLLGGQAAVACWDTSHWAVASTTPKPEQLARQLRRALAWLVFFARKKGEKAELTIEKIPGASFAATVCIGKHTFAPAILQSSTVLVVAGSIEDVQHASTGISRNSAAPDAWLSWQSNLPAPVKSRIAMKMTSWMFPKKDGDQVISQKDVLVPGLVYGNLLKLLGRERGMLQSERESMVLRMSGPGALVSGMALAATNCEKIVFSSSASSEAIAVFRLRFLLSAAQDYRHMGFGGGRYPARLVAMVTGTTSSGANLSKFYDRRYGSEGDAYSYTKLLTYLSQGGEIDLYRFTPASSIGGKPVTYDSQWALVAIPRTAKAGSGLVIYGDGTVYRRDKAELDLPEKRDDAGWSRRK